MSRYELQLVVNSNNPQADILITDHSLRIVARGAAPLHASLPPGIYGAKATIGNEETSTMFSLAEGEGTTMVELDSPDFYTPGLHERDCSVLELGVGSQIALTIHVAEMYREAVDQGAWRAALSRFRLLDDTFKPVLDLAKCASSSDGNTLTVCAALNPGAYILAHKKGASMRCMSLPAVENLRLACHVSLVTSGERREVVPDWPEMAIGYEKLDDQGRDGELLQAGEAIRKGMLEGKAYARTDWQRELLQRHFFDPMIGLYTAHLLLVEKDPDMPFLSAMIEKTASMLGRAHPDIIALRIGLRLRTGVTDLAGEPASLVATPVLATSWDLILKAQSESALPPDYLVQAPAIKNVVSNGLYLGWLRSNKRSLKRLVATVTKRAARSAKNRAIAGAGEIGALGVLLGTGLSTLGLLENDRHFLRKMAGSLVAGSIRRFRSEEAMPSGSPDDVARIMRELARAYPWRKIVRQAVKSPAVLSALEGLPLELMVILRDAAGDEEMLAAVTGSFVKEVVARTRTPLPALAQTVGEVAAFAAAFLAREPATT